MRIAEYITVEECPLYTHGGEIKALPSGSFVKPLRIDYVPKFIQEERRLGSDQTYCYTHFGIFPIYNKIIREVT